MKPATAVRVFNALMGDFRKAGYLVVEDVWNPEETYGIRHSARVSKEKGLGLFLWVDQGDLHARLRQTLYGSGVAELVVDYRFDFECLSYECRLGSAAHKEPPTFKQFDTLYRAAASAMAELRKAYTAVFPKKEAYKNTHTRDPEFGWPTL